jgi:hypothetical protein
MGIIYEVDGLDGWSFECRTESVVITPPPDVIFADARGANSIELDNHDILILQHVINQVVPKIRWGGKG